MSLQIFRMHFGLAKKPGILSLVLAVILLSGGQASHALIRSMPRQCLVVFATDYRSPQWTVNALITDYLSMDFFGREMKKDFIESAKNAQDQNAIYLDVENAVLKTLNDLTNDKMLITSLTNLHKKIFSDAIIRLIRDNKDTATLAYSDFKSMRFKFQFTNLSPVARKAFFESLRETFTTVNREYITALERLNLNLLGSAHLWFRGGVGESADEANIAARASREDKIENALVDLSSEQLRQKIWSWKEKAEKIRLNMALTFGRTPIFSADGFLTADAIDMIRKTSTNGELILRMKNKFRVEIFDYQATMLKRYLENVDRFAPGIYVIERQIASLERAELGGLSADFAGLGSKNLEATARALAGAKSLTEVLHRARQNEQQVTREFLELLKQFDEMIAPFFETRIPSGDDFVGYGSRGLSLEQRLEIMRQVAKLPVPAGQRIAFIPAGVAKKTKEGVSHRGLLAGHGESIEKDLRKSLEGKIPHGILKQMSFGVDMLGLRAGEGEVRLIVGLSPGLNPVDPFQIAAVERYFAAIKDHFTTVVQEFNLKSEGSALIKKYRSGAVIF